MPETPDAQVRAVDRANVVPLPFGVPSLDRLLGYADLDAEDLSQCLALTTSLAIVGQDGTGKSVFALHLAVAYHAVRHHLNQKLLGEIEYRKTNGQRYLQPLVLYVSSDLSRAE